MAENKMNTLNRVFTRSTLHHFVENRMDNSYSSVIKHYIAEPNQKKNRQLISGIYSELKDNYRNEYFYKNTLLNKLLLGVHSLKTTTALTEVPIAKSKADFVLINGKAVVYEIKTELDNFERLSSQIDDYFKVFDHVAVVSCEKNLPALKKLLDTIDKPVGIYVLQKNDRLRTVRKPEKFVDGLNKEAIFNILRKSEYEAILTQIYGFLPDVTQFRYYKTCKKMFLDIPIDDSYLYFLRQLKGRIKVEKDVLEDIPYELKFLGYFMELGRKEILKLDSFLEQEYREG